MKIALFIFELIEKGYNLKMIQINLLEYKIKEPQYMRFKKSTILNYLRKKQLHFEHVLNTM
jgi:hypothetical protein